MGRKVSKFGEPNSHLMSLGCQDSRGKHVERKKKKEDCEHEKPTVQFVGNSGGLNRLKNLYIVGVKKICSFLQQNVSLSAQNFVTLSK